LIFWIYRVKKQEIFTEGVPSGCALGVFGSSFTNPRESEWAMIKKKGKSKGKAAAKKTPKKKSAKKGRSDFNPAEVLKDIAQMVDSEAAMMTRAVIDEGKKGQLATVKYLFEMASIYPPSTDGSQATADEECLAKTLLRRLDMPDEPVVRDEEDPPKVASSTEKAVEKPAEEDEGKESGLEPEAGNASKDSVLV
jgi:hypothetical protein